MGIEVSEEKLEKAYDKRVKDYFLKNGLKTTENFIELVKKGEEFYPALNSQDDILTFLRNSDEVRNVLVPQVEAKGIGKIENVREGIVKGIVQEHNAVREKVGLFDVSHMGEVTVKGSDDDTEIVRPFILSTSMLPPSAAAAPSSTVQMGTTQRRTSSEHPSMRTRNLPSEGSVNAP